MSGAIQLIGNSGKVRLASAIGEVMLGSCCEPRCRSKFLPPYTAGNYSYCAPACTAEITVTGANAYLQGCCYSSLWLGYFKIPSAAIDGTHTLIFDAAKNLIDASAFSPICEWWAFLQKNVTANVYDDPSEPGDCSTTPTPQQVDIIAQVQRVSGGDANGTNTWSTSLLAPPAGTVERSVIAGALIFPVPNIIDLSRTGGGCDVPTFSHVESGVTLAVSA